MSPWRGGRGPARLGVKSARVAEQVPSHGVSGHAVPAVEQAGAAPSPVDAPHLQGVSLKTRSPSTYPTWFNIRGIGLAHLVGGEAEEEARSSMEQQGGAPAGPGQVTAEDWVNGISLSIAASIIGAASKLAIRKSWLMESAWEESLQPPQQQQHRRHSLDAYLPPPGYPYGAEGPRHHEENDDYAGGAYHLASPRPAQVNNPPLPLPTGTSILLTAASALLPQQEQQTPTYPPVLPSRDDSDTISSSKLTSEPHTGGTSRRNHNNYDALLEAPLKNTTTSIPPINTASLPSRSSPHHYQPSPPAYSSSFLEEGLIMSGGPCHIMGSLDEEDSFSTPPLRYPATDRHGGSSSQSQPGGADHANSLEDHGDVDPATKSKRHAHRHHHNAPAVSLYMAYTLRVGGMIGMSFLNPLCGVMAMNYASPSILAPFSGLTLVWIILLSQTVTGEQPSPTQVTAAGLIVMGEIIVALFGDHTNDVGVSVQDVEQSYLYRPFLLYFVLMFVWMVLLLCWMTNSKSPTLQRLSWGVSGGSLTGLQNFLKDTLTLVKAVHREADELQRQHEEEWTAPQDDPAYYNNNYYYSNDDAVRPVATVPSYLPLMIAMAMATAFGGLLLLTACMKRYDATYSSAMFVGSFVVSASIMSAIHYDTFQHLQAWYNYLLYPVGLLILLYGVYMLVQESPPPVRPAGGPPPISDMDVTPCSPFHHPVEEPFMHTDRLT